MPSGIWIPVPVNLRSVSPEVKYGQERDEDNTNGRELDEVRIECHSNYYWIQRHNPRYIKRHNRQFNINKLWKKHPEHDLLILSLIYSIKYHCPHEFPTSLLLSNTNTAPHSSMIAKQLITKQIQSKSIAHSNPNIVPTFNIFPSTLEYKDESITLGLVLKPFGVGQHEDSGSVPEVCYGSKGIIRCEICKAYMNPYNPIQKSNSSYYCCICGWINPLPTKYQPDEAVQRQNLTYDIIPFNNQFATNKISEPHIVLLVETSHQFLRTQAYQMMLSAIQYSTELLPPEQNVMLITYDDKCVSTYDLRGEGTRYHLTLDQKPIKDTLDRQVKDVKVKIGIMQENLIKILRMLPELYPTPTFQKHKLLYRRGMEYSIQCLFKIGGRILHFANTNIPPAGIHNGPKNREEGFYSPTIYYDKIARICNQHSISYSIFLHTNLESSVIEVADLCLQTKGSFRLYRKEDAVEQFYYHLIETLTEETVYTATSRLRCSCNTVERGEKTVLSQEWELSVNYKSNSSQLINYNNLSPDKIVVMSVNLRQSINYQYLVLQNSCLYMLPNGKTKLRVSNWAIPLSHHLATIHNSSNYEGLSIYFIRNQLQLLIKSRGVVKTMEERIMSFCKQIIFYKKYQWAQDLLLIALSLLKNKIGIKQKGMMFSKKKLEEMWVSIITLLDLNPAELLTQFIPQLFRVLSEEEMGKSANNEGTYLPPILPLIDTVIQEGNVYLMLCGKNIIVYYSLQYQGYRLHSEEPQNNITSLVEELSALNNYKHYRVRQTGHNRFAEEQYQDFMNYLLYSEGLYQQRITYQQFISLL